MNRTQYSEEIRPLSEFREAFRDADIIIYNLPVRLPELDQLGHEDFMEEKPKHILEANYRNPSFDKDLTHKLKGLHPTFEYTTGETWLLLQALTGYEIFTGEKPDLEKMAACL
jgi:shikimate 5-dehydrogenase